jgi:glutathione S-transferase
MVKSLSSSNSDGHESTNQAKLYVIPGSHACRAGILMLEHKGIDFQTAEIPTGFQAPLLRARGFPGRTVPALTFEGRRVQTNRAIARFLDELEPEPALLPSERREEIEEAERWADEVLQTLARRLVLAAGSRDLSLIDGYGDTQRLGPILAKTTGRRSRIMRIAARYVFKIDDYTEELDLAAVPEELGRLDAWVDSGLLDGPELNAADFQIAPSLCLLACRRDIRELVEDRPAWELVERLLPVGAVAVT